MAQTDTTSSNANPDAHTARRNVRPPASLIWLLSAAVLAPSTAFACSPSRCATGWFLPANGTTIPANAPAIAWLPTRDLAQSTDAVLPTLKLTRLDGGNNVSVNYTREGTDIGILQLIKPAQLVAGARYRLEETASCGTQTIEFAVGDEAPLPGKLGTPQLSAARDERVNVATISGSCNTQLSSVASHVDLAAAPDVAAWQALLMYRTVVDDEPWSPAWSLAGSPYDFTGAQTLIFTECPLPGDDIDPGARHQGLAQGEHRVRIEADLVGTDITLHSDERAISLRCGQSTMQPPAAGSSANEQSASSTGSDGARPSAAGASANAAVNPAAGVGGERTGSPAIANDASAPAGAASAPTSARERVRSGCSVARTTAGNAKTAVLAVWLGCSVFGLTLRRRSRRSL